MSLNTKSTFKLALAGVLALLVLFVLDALFSPASAGTLDEPVPLAWDNPTTRVDGSPITGRLTTRLYFSNRPGGTEIRAEADAGADSLTIVPRDIGLTAGDWYVHAVSIEADNPAGPSAASESFGPFVVVGDPSPPNPAANLRLQRSD